MARKNRIVTASGMYHLVSRVAHRAFLLKDPEVKDLIVRWMYGIADFCGITILDWTVLDNHFHIFVDVPPVPDSFRRGDLPAYGSPAAFSMRPPERRTPRVQPDLADCTAARLAGRPIAITAAGEGPSEEAVRVSVADGVPVSFLPRPPVGFRLPDDELAARLKRLYDGTSVKAGDILRRWARARQLGRAEAVEVEREAYHRRMYNVSQFMKTLKQRISEHFNRNLGHNGQLWEGRFYSGIVEDDGMARTILASYIDLNAVRAKLADRPSVYRWSAFAAACGDGPHAERAREGYERALGCPWEEARRRLESVHSEKAPSGAAEGERRKGSAPACPTMAQLVHVGASRLFRGPFFAVHASFGETVLAMLPKKFPAAKGTGILRRLERCLWTAPWHRTA